MVWFDKQYGTGVSATPIMVHQQTKPENAATLHPGARVLTAEKLIKTLRSYAIAVGENLGFTKLEVVAQHLEHFSLTSAKVVSTFTKEGK